MCDPDGELFIKPCTQAEIDFYQSANRRHADFAAIMPLYLGSLTLNDPDSLDINEAVAGLISEAGDVKTSKEEIVASVASQVAAAMPDPAADSGSWTPRGGKKIETDKSVVLENSSFGFKQPNILDVKLGVRLYADDAPAEKKQRFEKISAETTHGNFGFRISGMRVFRGSEDRGEWDEEEYKIYDKDYGRLTVNDQNVADEFRKFIFNKSAGIDEELGKAVCEGFLRDLNKVIDIMSRNESRMFSSSLLFVFEGDGDALRSAIEDNNASIEAALTEKLNRTTKRVDSGIALEDDDDLSDDGVALPHIYTLKLIDFAHAEWTPGKGPDENTLTGVRSLARIFEQMAQ